ncbi:MAG TPA: hypothetical protein VLA34_02535, partial [Candidatus Krumholzibacterium sp.]|nr:hypothetical protein [Candidatus Krumholzibacterium sp.]
FREDLARRVEHNVRMVEAWDGWRWEIGERYKSLATGKVWTVTGKVWRDRKNEGVYYMETADGERATFIPSVAHEGFIKMTGPTGSLARDLTTDELRELRVLRAAVQYEGATYISPAGQAHWRALQKIPKIAMLRSEAERDAALDEVFANSESGFVDADGNFMTREESAQWVKTNDPRTFKVLQKHHFSYFPGEPRLESMGYFDAMGLYHEGDVAYLSRDMTNDNTAIPTVEVKGKTVTYYAQTWNPITRREIIRDLRERTDVESVVYQVVSRPPASGIPVILAEIKGSRVDAMGGLLEQNFERERRNKKVTPGSLSRAHWSGVVQGMGNKYKEVLRRAKDDARRVNTLKDAAKLFERQWLSKLDFMLKVLPFSSKVDIYGDMFKAGVRGERDLLQELYTMIKQASYEQNKAPGEADLLYKEAEKLTGGKNTQAWKNLELAMDVNTFLEME